MLNPENATSPKFRDFTVLYNEATFAIAYDNTEKIILMRWNGETKEDNSYPMGRANTPFWFRVQKKLAKPILIMLLTQEKANTNKVLEIFKTYSK